MIFIIGITLAFFLEFLLIAKKKKTKADKVLAIWFLAIGLHLLSFYLRYEQKYYFFPTIIGLDISLPLIHCPLLFLYVLFITDNKQNGVLYIVHFLPFLASFLYTIPFLVSPIENKIQIFENKGQGYEIFNAIKYVVTLISGIVYFSWSLLILKRHRKNINNLFSNTDFINLNWLRYLIYGIGIIWFAVAFLNEIYIFGSVVVFVILIGVIGIRQTEIFTEKKEIPDVSTNNDITPPPTEATNEISKYEKSGVSNELSERVYSNLVELMKEKKVYKNSDLNLSALAKMLHTHSNYLSQIINEKTGKNFYSYINNLRIDEFKRLILLPENSSEKILPLAYDCGFNTKSSFNKYFKLSTGITPSEFVRQYKN